MLADPSLSADQRVKIEKMMAEREARDPRDSRARRADAAFDTCDTDGSGELDLHEFRHALQDFGLIPNDAEFERILQKFDDGSRSIDRVEFRVVVDTFEEIIKPMGDEAT